MTPAVERLTAAQARRTALAAQGLAQPRPAGRVTARHLDRVLAAVHLLQIDSISVLARSHYLPLLARLGPYDRELLTAAAERPPRRLLEYWAHEASFVTPQVHGLMRWRRERHATDAWRSMTAVAREAPTLVDEVLACVADEGPVTAREVEAALVARRAGAAGVIAGAPGGVSSGTRPRGDRAPRGPWWDWSQVKAACEHLFWSGAVTAAGRTATFERRYDLPERVLPPSAAAGADLDPDAARRELVRLAAAALGVAAEPHLRDYFRLSADDGRRAVAELLDAGELVPVAVQGWAAPALLWPAARHPRAVRARALLSPFDSLVFHRGRTEVLFGVRHRLEVYVPEARRVHGYYVLLFLLGEELRARVDLRRDTAASALVVRAAWLDAAPPGRGPAPGGGEGRGASDAVVAVELAEELGVMAGWLGLERVVVEARGDLAPALASALARR